MAESELGRNRGRGSRREKMGTGLKAPGNICRGPTRGGPPGAPTAQSIPPREKCRRRIRGPARSRPTDAPAAEPPPGGQKRQRRGRPEDGSVLRRAHGSESSDGGRVREQRTATIVGTGGWGSAGPRPSAAAPTVLYTLYNMQGPHSAVSRVKCNASVDGVFLRLYIAYIFLLTGCWSELGPLYRRRSTPLED